MVRTLRPSTYHEEGCSAHWPRPAPRWEERFSPPLPMRRPVPRPSRVRSRPSASRRRAAQRTDALAYARGVLDAEAAAILGAKGRLGASFLRVLELMRA